MNLLLYFCSSVCSLLGSKNLLILFSFTLNRNELDMEESERRQQLSNLLEAERQLKLNRTEEENKEKRLQLEHEAVEAQTRLKQELDEELKRKEVRSPFPNNLLLVS